MNNSLLFKVVCGEKAYEIFTDGEIRGFESPAIVFNHYPEALGSAIASVRLSDTGETEMRLSED